MSNIIFGGILVKNNICYITFINSDNVSVEIPIEKVSADRIEKYLSRIYLQQPEEKKYFPNKDINMCRICLQDIRNGDAVETLTKINIDGTKLQQIVHVNCLPKT